MVIHTHFSPKVFLVSHATPLFSCVDERPQQNEAERNRNGGNVRNEHGGRSMVRTLPFRCWRQKPTGYQEENKKRGLSNQVN